MAYAQTSYQQVQGINGRYTIHDIGCFLTSFCNLLTLRYGRQIDPSGLNDYFVAHDNYVDVDDGIRDDLAWSTIGKYSRDVIVTRLVDKGTSRTAGLPATTQSIVKFYYQGPSGRWTTHFCLYDGDGYIIDSWDGKRKTISSTIYGAPVAFAEYAVAAPAASAPQNVTPPQGDEMIANADQATKLYKMLRPNGGPSQDEVNGTAGKRTFAGFLNDAQAEINSRDANLRGQAQSIVTLQSAINSQGTTISELTNKLNDENLDDAAKQKALDEALNQIVADNVSMADLHKQIDEANKAVAAGAALDQVTKPVNTSTFLQRLLAFVLRLKK